MPSRKAQRSRKRKGRQSKTIKDFFAVERTIKKRMNTDLKEDTKIAPDTVFRVNSVIPNSSAATGYSYNGDVAIKKAQRKMRLTKLTEFYPIRRSNRKPESEIKKAKRQEIEETVLCEKEPGLQVRYFDGKGRGVVATRQFRRGDYVVEYRGDLIDYTEAKRRESVYEQDPAVGCYMYYFQHKNQGYCVDATAETGYLGRLLNHSAKEPNCVTRIVEVKNIPHLILVAARDINAGEELLYDYGDRSRHAVEANPWLKTT